MSGKMEQHLSSQWSSKLGTAGASAICGGSLFHGPAEGTAKAAFRLARWKRGWRTLNLCPRRLPVAGIKEHFYSVEQGVLGDHFAIENLAFEDICFFQNSQTLTWFFFIYHHTYKLYQKFAISVKSKFLAHAIKIAIIWTWIFYSTSANHVLRKSQLTQYKFDE